MVSGGRGGRVTTYAVCPNGADDVLCAQEAHIVREDRVGVNVRRQAGRQLGVKNTEAVKAN